MSTVSTLEQLRLSVLGCYTCGEDNVRTLKTGEEKRTPVVKIPKGQTRVTDSSDSPVPGYTPGTERVRFMWIGEAPGVDEDKEGKGFIGRSGQYLKRHLIAKLAGIDLNECWFTNIIKCHPEGNRNPYAGEIKACSTWIDAEIALVKPEIIFLVGAVPIKAMLGIGLAESHGQVYEYKGIPTMPMYHPAGVNRATPQRKLEKDYREILPKLEVALDDGKVKKAESGECILVSSLDSLQDMFERLARVDTFALDIETDETEWARSRGRGEDKGGVDPITNTMVGLSLAFEVTDTGLESYFVPLADYADKIIPSTAFGSNDWQQVRLNVLGLLQEHANRSKVYIQNAKFEMESLDKYEFEIRNPYCTYLAAYLMNEDTLGLKAIIKRTFSVEMTELGSFLNLKKQVVSEAPLAKIFPYAAADAEWCYKYGVWVEGQLEARGQTELFTDILMGMTPWVVKEELSGIEIDNDKRLELEPGFRVRLNEIENDAYQIAHEEAEWDEFNIRSNPQRGKLLDDLGVEDPGKRTATGLRATDKDTLAIIRETHNIVPLLIEHGSLQTIKSTFIDGVPKLINPETQRLHANINQATTTTMRLSFDSPNWSNQPIRTKESKRIREQVVADEIGWWIVAVDQSQIELRWAAHLSQDKWMIEGFHTPGWSIHTENCKIIYEVEESHDNWDYYYKNTKNGNFAGIYGAELIKMAETLEIPVRQAAVVLARLRNTAPEYWAWTDSQKKLVKELGYAETYFKFRREVPEIRSPNRIMRQRGERIAVNTPIQGSAAGHNQLAITQIFKTMRRKRMASRMIIQVHDELVFSCPEEEVEEVVEIAVDRLEHCVELSIPTPVEVEIGENWGELKPYEEWTAEVA
tara:strand:- start:116 stop:2707 length:2592 start_codon:yes stop_codon:yes gene_type:complete